MKKKFKVEVDCANCASKVEEAISKIEGVTSVTVNFLTQKMTLEAEEDNYEEILKEAQRRCAKVEPDFVIYTD